MQVYLTTFVGLSRWLDCMLEGGSSGSMRGSLEFWVGQYISIKIAVRAKRRSVLQRTKYDQWHFDLQWVLDIFLFLNEKIS